MQQDFISVSFEKSHLTTIGSRLYTQSLDLIRELVANAYDADAQVVKITVNESTLLVEDDGTGMDRHGLQQYFTIGSTFKKEHPTTSRFKRVRIGEFGIGKFAVLSICDRFEIYTRSSSYAATLIFDREDFENKSDWNLPVIEHHTVKNQKTGTRISLFQLKKPFSLFDIERHVINVFPLSDTHFSIILNEKKLQPKYIAGQRFPIRETCQFGNIAGEVIISSLSLPKEMIGIGIRVKGVLIRRETFEIDSMHSLSIRRLTGEINADFLPMTTSRDEFITDSDEYKEFCTIMSKKLRRVIRSLEKSALSYQDKKAEKILSDALLTVRSALRKNKDILLLEGLPLFTRRSQKMSEAQQSFDSGVIATALVSQKSSGQKTPSFSQDGLKEALHKLRPNVRSRIKTLLRDDKRIVKKVKIGGSEFLVSFAHLGQEEKESFVEGGIIFINRDHGLYKRIERKSELIMYHLIRLVTQEIVKLSEVKDMEGAFDWHGKLIKDSFLLVKE